MKKKTPAMRFRQAAESADGIPVSAGARIVHVRGAVEAGRVFYVDLSSVPENNRPNVITEIQQIVSKASESRPAKSKTRRSKAS